MVISKVPLACTTWRGMQIQGDAPLSKPNACRTCFPLQDFPVQKFSVLQEIALVRTRVHDNYEMSFLLQKFPMLN